MKRTTRKPSKLSDSLQRHLNAYTLAASAAGMGMLALAQPAEAKIVYTPANKTIRDCTFNERKCFKLDLNHDKIADFSIMLTTRYVIFLDVRPDVTGNEIWGSTYLLRTHTVGAASALRSGVAVGANSVKFQGSHGVMFGLSTGAGTSWGKWKDVRNRYLGLMFYIKGKVHYGWARLNDKDGDATLTGYAYETIPNKAIITGKTKGSDVITIQPGSLGRLAQGSAGIQVQRSGK